VIVANAFGSSTSAPVRLSVTQVAAWGANFDRQLEVPASATNVVAVYAGMFHSVALREMALSSFGVTVQPMAACTRAGNCSHRPD